MKYLLGFLLGVLVATAGQLMAQSTGIFTDERGRIYQYGTMPGGSANIWGPNGQHGTIYQAPSFGKQSPC